MSNRYLQTVSTVAIGSVAFGAAMTEKAEAQDTGYALSFSGGIGEAHGLTFGSGGGFFDSDPGSFGAIVVSRQFGPMEGSVGLSFYNQDSSTAFSGGFGPGPSGGPQQGFSGGSYYFKESTSWRALDIMASQQTGTPGLSWGAGMRGLSVKQSLTVGHDGYYASGGGSGGGFLANVNTEAGATAKFVGLGPRVSVKYSTAPVVGSFGFTGEAGVSALFGKHTQEVYAHRTINGIDTGSGGGDSSEDNFLATLDLTLQADYHISESSKIFVGVQAQKFIDLADEFGEGTVGTESVFMGFKTEF